MSELSFVRHLTGNLDGRGLGSANARTSVLPPLFVPKYQRLEVLCSFFINAPFAGFSYNTSEYDDASQMLKELSDGGFDDVFVMAPVSALFNLAEKICREDGCINFFAGPPIHDLQGSLNLYRIHYDGIHVVGTAGSIPEDTLDTIKLIEENKLQTGALVSHILGLKAIPETVLAMEKPNGAKKVCYNHLDLPLVAIADFEKLGKTDKMFAELDKIVKNKGGLWCKEAEDYLLEHAPKL